MLHNNKPVTAELLDEQIEHYEMYIEKIKAIKAAITDYTLYEVGICKASRKLVHLDYSIEYGPDFIIWATTIPEGTKTKLTLQQFKDEYAEYSPKARSLLPRKES